MQLITVVLASGWGDRGREQKWVDTKRLLDYGFNNYEYKEVIVKGGQAGNITVERSKNQNIPVLYSEGLIMPVNEEEWASIAVTSDIASTVKAPVALGEEMGVAKVFLGDELYAKIPIITAESAERHDLKTSLEKVISGWLELGTWENVEVLLPEIDGGFFF
jgi:D-alanyl-D-alanine carboxypeptidase (penicillin-binding protein 5/6)